MNATVHQLPVPGGAPPRYGPDIDLRELIRKGDQIDEPIRYTDDTWNLRGCDEATKAHTLRFARIPRPFRDLVKDYALLRGSPRIALEWAPDNDYSHNWAQNRTSWNTTIGRVKRVVRPISILNDLGFTSVLDPEDWFTFSHELLMREDINPQSKATTKLSPEAAARVGQILREVHQLGALMGRPEPFGTAPWGTEEINAVFGHRPPAIGEYRNKSHPVADVFAINGACLNFIDTCASDIIDRVTWWTRRAARIPPPDSATTAFRQALSQWETTGCPVPADPGTGAPLRRLVTVYAGWGDVNVKWVEDVPTWLSDVTDPACDPYLADNPELSQPHWVPPGHHLLPISEPSGLWWWANRLVYACYYVIAAVTGLRGLEIDALRPDCLNEPDEPVRVMTGRKVKNAAHAPNPEVPWTVNDHVVLAIDTMNALREASAVGSAIHDRFRNPVLFSNNLLNWHQGYPSETSALNRPLASHTQRNLLFPALAALAQSGAAHWSESIKPHKGDVIRNTSFDAYVDRQYGDLAVAAQARHTTLSVAYGYIGHRPQVTFPAFPEEIDEHRAKRGEVGAMVQDIADENDKLSGPGVERLRRQLPLTKIQRGMSVQTFATMITSGEASAASVGPLSGCATPEGGRCGGVAAANHRLCMLGCQNGIYGPYDRARIEYQRRVMARTLGRHSNVATKIAPDVVDLSIERRMTDRQLIDQMTSKWPAELVEWLIEEMELVGR